MTSSSLLEIIPLLYRARSIDLFLSARVVRRTWKSEERNPAFNTLPDSQGKIEYRGLIRTAPGGRYRVDLTDQDGDDYVVGCDGQRSWNVVEGVPRSLSPNEGVPNPFKDLLAPNWLMAGFSFDEITADQITAESFGGVATYRIHAIPRQGAYQQVGSGREYTEVNALIDARLGILLRCETLDGKGHRIVSELSEIREGPSAAGADEAFYLPTQAEDPRIGVVAAVSAEHQAEADRPSSDITDDSLNLLYRSLMPPAEFSGMLSEQSNPSLAIRAASEILGASSKTASRIMKSRWLQSISRKNVPTSSSRIAELRISMPEQICIDFRDETRGSIRSIVYDGHKTLKAYNGRNGSRIARSFPAGIGLMVDPAWMLDGYELTEDGSDTVSGRSAIRFSAAARCANGEILKAPLADNAVPADEVEVAVDEELGIVLRLTARFRGQLALTCTLDEIEPLEML